MTPYLARFAALSRTPFIQADRAFPAPAAASSYLAFRSTDTRISSRSVSGLSTGGRPRGRFAGSFMGEIMPVQIFVDKAPDRVFNVRTVKQGGGHVKKVRSASAKSS